MRKVVVMVRHYEQLHIETEAGGGNVTVDSDRVCPWTPPLLVLYHGYVEISSGRV